VHFIAFWPEIPTSAEDRGAERAWDAVTSTPISPCRTQAVNRHSPDSRPVGRDLPSLGVPRQRNSIAAGSLTAKTARCSASLGRNSLLCVDQGVPLPSSAVAPWALCRRPPSASLDRGTTDRRRSHPRNQRAGRIPLVVSASTSSNSRYASNPPSEVIAEPWNRSITRRSKSSLSAPPSASPAGSAMAAPFDPTQHIVGYTAIRPVAPQNTVPSGE
jgi:hypothetical protein